jgi:hypothetical protein
MDNIKLDFVEIGFGSVGWIGYAQDKENWRALVNEMMNRRVRQTAGRLSSG